MPRGDAGMLRLMAGNGNGIESGESGESGECERRMLRVFAGNETPDARFPVPDCKPTAIKRIGEGGEGGGGKSEAGGIFPLLLPIR